MINKKLTEKHIQEKGDQFNKGQREYWIKKYHINNNNKNNNNNIKKIIIFMFCLYICLFLTFTRFAFYNK